MESPVLGLAGSSLVTAGQGEGEDTRDRGSSKVGPVSSVGEKKPVSVGQTRGTFFSA